MGMFFSYFKKAAPTSEPIKGAGPRIKNLVVNNFRGLLGFFIGFAFLPSFNKGDNAHSVTMVWLLMIWYFFMQPCKVPVTALLPLFVFPLTGVISSDRVCLCYFSDSMALTLIAGMMMLLLNNAHVDRRVALYLLCRGKFSARHLVFKASETAFLLSMVSNRLLVTSTITDITTPILMDMKAGTSNLPAETSQPDYDRIRHIVNNAIQSSSVIGSLAILHASFATMAFKAIWTENAGDDAEYPDIFNYLQYSAFAVPVATIMFYINVAYNMGLVTWFSKPCTSAGMIDMKAAFLSRKAKLKSINLYEIMTIVFTVLFYVALYSRWSSWLGYGWATFRAIPDRPEIPGVKDATVAAFFVLVMFCLPKDFHFLKYLSANKENELPPCKPASSLLWWRFVDMNTNYSYLFLFGSGIALNVAIKSVGLDVTIATNIAQHFTSLGWNITILGVVVVTAVMANLMTSVAACVVIMPFVLSFGAVPTYNDPWPSRMYLGALGVGLASAFGFMQPFHYTPAYFTFLNGKTPRPASAIFGIGSVFICTVILWLALIFYAPVIFDPNGLGITSTLIKILPPGTDPTTTP